MFFIEVLVNGDFFFRDRTI